ncbi:MAG: hypothetical protein KC656_30810, partial [Myxococcales bacterium]|nr:hypothetical protein [Myxococcales bacterium]
MSDLYAAVDRSPGALAPRLVLADWLQTRGDPRGQLGVAQHALAVDPDDVAMRAQVGRMLREHPDLAPSLPVFDEEPEYLDVRWRIGFVDRLVVRVCPWFEWDEAALADAVEALVSHEGCRFLRELVVLVEEWPGRGRNAEAALMRARARRPSLQSTVAGALVESGTTDLDGLDASRLRWVTAAPEEIAGRASELVHLEYLRLVTDRTSLPEALGELPALRRLDLADCAGLRSIPAAVLTIPTLQAIRTYGCDGLSACGYSMARIDPALAGWARVNASRERRRVELDLLLGRTPDATVEDLLRALDSNVTAIRRTALQVLAERLAPADLEGEVALAGSFDARTGELKLLLQESGSTVRSRPTAKTRWVVVGEKPKGAQLAALAAGRGLALERDVLALREAGHAEAPPDVLADLRSRDPARTTAALDALKHGRLDGLHVTEVLAVSQDTALPAGVRKAAKKLFSIS